MGDGYYIDDNRSWSIDNRRLNFQFGTEVAYEVTRRQARPAAAGLLLRRRSPRSSGGRSRPSPGPEEFRAFGCPAARASPSSGASSATAPRPCSCATCGSESPDERPQPLRGRRVAAGATARPARRTPCGPVRRPTRSRSRCSAGRGEYTRFAGDRVHQPQDIDETQIMVRGRGRRARAPGRRPARSAGARRRRRCAARRRPRRRRTAAGARAPDAGRAGDGRVLAVRHRSCGTTTPRRSTRRPGAAGRTAP